MEDSRGRSVTMRIALGPVSMGMSAVTAVPRNVEEHWPHRNRMLIQTQTKTQEIEVCINSVIFPSPLQIVSDTAHYVPVDPIICVPTTKVDEPWIEFLVEDDITSFCIAPDQAITIDIESLQVLSNLSDPSFPLCLRH